MISALWRALVRYPTYPLLCSRKPLFYAESSSAALNSGSTRNLLVIEVTDSWPRFQRLVRLIEANDVHPVVDKVFEVSLLRRAHGVTWLRSV